MLNALRDLGRVLRGEATGLPALRDGRTELPIGRLVAVVALLAAVYGGCMGTFALLREGGPCWLQLVATVAKVPALFFLTLLITFPSLYVFNALVGSRLDAASVARLLTAAMGVTVAVLASLGPIEAFFALSTKSYSFMVLLNVLIFAVSGALGLVFLLQTLQRISTARVGSMTPPAPPAVSSAPLPGAPQPPPLPERAAGPLERLPGQVLAAHVKTVFRCWVIVFGLVGAQMGWVLRPFVGSPGEPVQFFREGAWGNAYEVVSRLVWNTLVR